MIRLIVPMVVRSWKIWLRSLASAVMLTAAATACASDSSVPLVEARAQEVNKSLMCPVCPGESIDQSQHPRAEVMRSVVDEKIEDGWTDDEIRQFFVERYGPSVLLDPPREGMAWLVWAVPPVMLLAGGVALYLVLRFAVRSAGRRRGASEEGLTDRERSEYYERIEEVIGLDAGPQSGSQSPAGTQNADGAGESVAR